MRCLESFLIHFNKNIIFKQIIKWQVIFHNNWSLNLLSRLLSFNNFRFDNFLNYYRLRFHFRRNLDLFFNLLMINFLIVNLRSKLFSRLLRNFTWATRTTLTCLIGIIRGISSILARCVKGFIVKFLCHLSLFIFSLMMTNYGRSYYNLSRWRNINWCDFGFIFCLLLSDCCKSLFIEQSFLLLCLDSFSRLFQFNLPLSIGCLL